MNIMNIQNQSNINFKSRISAPVMQRINIEKKCCGERRKVMSKLVKTKLKDIKKWGSPDTEIVITKNMQGKFCLGLKLKLDEFTTGTWAIRSVKGKTILSRILNLHESNIVTTEKSIRFLYERYGSDIFSKPK